jgi:hypothetical protein
MWCDVVCCTTVHHPTHSLGSIQGNTNFEILDEIVDLLNGGGTWYYLYMAVGCFITTARCGGLLCCLCLILLPLAAIRLDVPLFIAVVASETGVVPLFATSFDGGSPSCIE